MQNPTACLSQPSLTAAPGSVLEHISHPSLRYETGTTTAGVSSFDQTRSYSDPRSYQQHHTPYHNPLAVHRPHHVSYDCAPHSYQSQGQQNSGNNGYSGFGGESGRSSGSSVYRSEGEPGFKSYCWTNGNTSDYEQHPHPTVEPPHLPVTGLQSGYSTSGNICQSLPSSRSSPAVLPAHSPSHPASWSPRTTPSPHVSSPGGSHRSPASPFLSPQALPPPLVANGGAVSVPITSQGASHPLHSLQQMVDPESSNSSPSFDPSGHHTPPTTSSNNKMQSGPTCYPPADQSTGSSSAGNVYPTYYNMDQNRLCSDQELSVQRGVGNSHQQEKQVRNSITNDEITSEGRVLPPQPKDVNQKTPYFPLHTSSSNCLPPDAHTLVNGTATTTSSTTPSSSSWNGSQQWNGLTNGPAAQQSWPTNGLPVTSTTTPPTTQYPNPVPQPLSQPQAFPVPSVSQASGHGSQGQQSSSWSGSEGQSLPGGAPAPVQKKKRGRPFGSKNKPKNPDQVAATPTPGRKKPGRKPKSSLVSSDTPSHRTPHAPPVATMASGDMGVMPGVRTMSEDGVSGMTGAVARNKKNVGPFIRVDKDQGLAVYTITNCAMSAANAKDSGLRPAHLLSRQRHDNQRMTSSAPMTSSHALDHNGSWICVFCKQGPHHEALGDLFGPYFVPKATHSSPRAGQEDTSSKSPRKRKSSEAEVNSTMNCDNSNKNQMESQEEVWFHEDCISWSSGVYLVGHTIRNMEEIVRDSADSMCSFCGLNGANMGCVFGGCQLRYHFLCARKSKCDFNEENYSVLCERHKEQFQKMRTQNPDTFLSSTIF